MSRRALVGAGIVLSLSVLGLALTRWTDGVTLSGRVVQPANGSSQPLGWLDVTGSAHGVPTVGPHQLWRVEHLAGFYWPQQQVILREGQWTGQVRLDAGTDDIGKRLDVIWC